MNPRPPATFHCPIEPDVNAVIESAEDLRKTLKKLRRDLAACQSCPMYAGCGKWEGFQAVIRQAVHNAALEWQPNGNLREKKP